MPLSPLQKKKMDFRADVKPLPVPLAITIPKAGFPFELAMLTTCIKSFVNPFKSK